MALSSSEFSALQSHGILAGFLDQSLFGSVLDRKELHRSHLPGEVVIRKQGTPGGMFVVVHGTLEMVLSNRNGGEHMVRIVKAGDCLGVENVLCDTEAIYELRTLTQASLLFVPKEDVIAWIDGSADFSRRLMHLLADDVADLYEELDGLQSRSTIERLACYLHCGEGRERRGQPLLDEYTIALPYMKLAQRLNTSQPHLSRAMRNLEDAGMIGRTGRRVRIHDKGAFARLLCSGCQQAYRKSLENPLSAMAGPAR